MLITSVRTLPVSYVDSSRTVARPKKTPDASAETRDRLDLRIPPDLRARAEVMAERFGLTLSAYIRQAMAERLERDEATRPESPP